MEAPKKPRVTRAKAEPAPVPVATPPRHESLTWLFLILATLFVMSLVVSNIAAFKMIAIGPWAVPAAVLIFPISYIMSDVITEVYGFKKARNVIFLGFCLNLFVVLYFQLTIVLKAPAWFTGSDAYATVLSNTPRVLTASFVAYLIGSYFNSLIMSVMKRQHARRCVKKQRDFANGGFGVRAIVSTLIGEGLDASIFIFVAFYGLMDLSTLITMVIVQWCLKVLYEVIILPVTTQVVKTVKKYEEIDTLDDKGSYHLFK